MGAEARCDVLTVVTSGVSNGAFFILIALGVVLVQRFADTLNFAQGGIATLGAYCVFEAHHRGVPYVLSWVIAITVTGVVSLLLGVAVERWFSRASHLVRSMSTLGPALALIGVTGMAWSQNLRPVWAPPYMAGTVTIGQVSVSRWGLCAMALVVCCLILIGATLKWTRLGVELRAMSDSKVLARVHGVRVRRLQWFVWGVSGAIAGLAGVVISSANQLDPQYLTTFLITAFIAAILGGLRNVVGLVGGGVILGVLLALVQYEFDRELANSAALVILLICLMVRPSGLFASQGRELSAGSLDDLAALPRPHRRRTRSPAGRPSPVSVTGVTSALARAARGRLLRVVGVVLGLAAFGGSLSLSNASIFALATACAMALAVSGQNIASGQAGQLSLAQGGVMLVGAYTAAVFCEDLGTGVVGAAMAAIIVCAIVGAILATAAGKVTGISFAIVTMAFTLAMPEVARNLETLTHGEIGFIVPPLGVGGLSAVEPRTVYVVSAGVMMVALIPLYLASRSIYGKTWRAVRDSVEGARALGVTPHWPRVAAFTLASGAGGLAGSLIAFQTGIVTPASFTIYTSIYILVAAALGGESSTFVGPMVGALFITLLPVLLNQSGAMAQVLFGVITFVLLALRASAAVPGGLTVETITGREAQLAERPETHSEVTA